MKTKLFVSVAVMMALTAIASAQTTEQPAGQSLQGGAAGTAWVDSDNDGVCDNFENGTRQGRPKGLAQGPGSRHPRHRGMMAGRGAGRCRVVAPGRGLYNGQGPAFTDANNDGVCDNLANASEKK